MPTCLPYPFPNRSAKHVPNAGRFRLRKFSRLCFEGGPVNIGAATNGKKTAGTCPNMTVSADVRNSDGTAGGRKAYSLDQGSFRDTREKARMPEWQRNALRDL